MTNSPRNLKIVQFTDIHIARENVIVNGAIDTRANLNKMLKAVSEVDCDLIVFTGDSCYKEPHREIYEWTAAQMTKALGTRRHLSIPGNHDESKTFSKFLGGTYHIETNEVYFSIQEKGTPIFFLDTGKGYLSDVQLNWLGKKVRAAEKDDFLIFMHHPPLISGVPYMDNNHSLKDMDKFTDLLHSYTDKRFNIFCGHYHVDRFVKQKNISVFITPSCYVQIDGSQEDFAIDHYRIGYRVIEFQQSGKMMTYVHYL